MYEYSINVARKTDDKDLYYRHAFKVELGKNGDSSGTPSNVRQVLAELIERYPEPDFKITISRRSLMWTQFDADHFLESVAL